MIIFKGFSTLKNIFSRTDIFNLSGEEKYSKSLSSDELLEITIKNCSMFRYVVLTALYHLINTNNKNNEYLTVLSINNEFIIDLMEGKGNNVKVPDVVKIEGEKGNILVACHNHFFGAIIPSLDDISTTINNHFPFVAIVSCNHIGILIIESDEIDFEQFKIDFEWFREYISFCVHIEKSQEIDKIDKMEISEEEREELKSIIHDKFLSENIEKFVNEFNNRFNKYKIYEIYIII